MICYIIIVIVFWLCALIIDIVTHDRDKLLIYLIFYFPYLFVYLFIILLRYKFVVYYQLVESTLQTLYISVLCWPCSLCQMARHQYGYKNILDGDARFDGSQVYSQEYIVIV